MTNLHMTQTAKFNLGKLLETIIDRHEDGTCSYRDDYTDTKVAVEQNWPSSQHVQRFRQELFGKLRVRPGTKRETSLETLFTRVALLEHQIIAIHKHLGIGPRDGIAGNGRIDGSLNL